MSNGHLVVVLQKDEGINKMLEDHLEQIDPHVSEYVFFTTLPLVAQQACDDGAYAMLSCNYPCTEYDATNLAMRCRMENSDLIFITYSVRDVPFSEHMAYIDAHIDKARLIADNNVLVVTEIIAELARGLSLEVLLVKYSGVLMSPNVPC